MATGASSLMLNPGPVSTLHQQTQDCSDLHASDLWSKPAFTYVHAHDVLGSAFVATIRVCFQTLSDGCL